MNCAPELAAVEIASEGMYYVRWSDSCVIDGEHAVSTLTADHGPRGHGFTTTTEAVGFVLRDTGDSLIFASRLRNDGQAAAGVFVVPRINVEELFRVSGGHQSV